MSSASSSISEPPSLKSPELRLVNKFHDALGITVQKYVSSVKFSVIKKHFPELYKEKPEELKYFHEQLCSQLKSSIAEDLNEICKEKNIDFLLQSLEEIKQNQVSTEQAWRPSGEPEEDLRDHLYPIKVKHKEALENILNELQQSNEAQMTQIELNHYNLIHLKNSVAESHAKFSEVVNVLTGSRLHSLQDKLKDLEAKI